MNNSTPGTPSDCGPELVRKLARMARISLDEIQATDCCGHLDAMLKYADRLSKLDLDDIEPMTFPTDQTNHLREDDPDPAPRTALDQATALALAPETDPPFYAVPKTIASGGKTP